MKQVLITGGTGELGLALTHIFLKKKYYVHLADIDQERQSEQLAHLKDHPNISFHQINLCNPNEIKALGQKLAPQIDLVINNAGVVSGKSLLDLSTEDIDRTFQVNSIAPLHIYRAFLPEFLNKGHGHFIDIASAAGLMGVNKLSDYSASKFAHFGAHESLRMEIKKNKWNIDMTIVCPFFIKTKLFSGAKTRFPFLLPILKVENVAKAIIHGIEKKKTRILIPSMVWTVWIMRYLPTDIYDYVGSFLGMSSSMEDFKGHNKP